MTQARLSRVSPHLGQRVLDVGCGYGELLDYLTPKVEFVALLDRSPRRQEQVNARIAQRKIQAQFLIGEIDRNELKLSLASFDTVVMAALLEHLSSPTIALQNVHRVLRANGKLILTTPTPLGGKLHRLGSHLGLVYREAAQEHEHFYNFQGLKWLLTGQGFVVEHYEGFLLGLNQLVVARKS